MSEILAGAALAEFFDRGFARTAWRWETRPEYELPEERQELALFLLGGPAGDEEGPWRRTLRSLRRRGRCVARARVVDEPPTAYQRWLLARARQDVEAGEDLRCLTRSEALRLHVPLRDFWLFDEHTVGFVRFEGDRPLGMELTRAPDAAAVARRVREAAWEVARPVGAAPGVRRGPKHPRAARRADRPDSTRRPA